jgi:hypothetical protein
MITRQERRRSDTGASVFPAKLAKVCPPIRRKLHNVERRQVRIKQKIDGKRKTDFKLINDDG